MPRTRQLVAVTHVSNVLGTVNPIERIVALGARRRRAGAGCTARRRATTSGRRPGPRLRLLRAVAPQDVRPDRHGRAVGSLLEHLAAMPPWQGGGDMIRRVSFAKHQLHRAPARSRPGRRTSSASSGSPRRSTTCRRLDRPRSLAHEDALLALRRHPGAVVPGLRLIGEPRERVGVLCSCRRRAPATTTVRSLDRQGIAVRTGQHCAQPVHDAVRPPGVRSRVLGRLQHHAEDDRLSLPPSCARLRVTRAQVSELR